MWANSGTVCSSYVSIFFISLVLQPRPVKLARNFRMDPEVPIKLKAVLRKQ